MKFILIIAALLINFSLISQAALPTYCTDFTALPAGWTESGVGTQPTHDNCAGPSKRFNLAGNSLTVNFTGVATNVRYSISRNGAQVKTLVVQESVTGAVWTNVATWTEINTPLMATIQTNNLLPTTRFVRFNMTVRTGGRMEIDLVNVYNGAPHPVGGTCILLPLNCQNATAICSDATFSGNSDDFGAQELNGTNQGCLSTEHQSSWYFFQPISSGTMELSVNPTAGIDYDFAIWSTNSCASLGTPVRCSFSAINASTGLATGSGHNSEDASGDGWVNELNLVAGQTYIFLLDNFTADNTSFNIDFTLSGGAALDCTPTPLPIGLSSFEGQLLEEENLITWETDSEMNNDYFTLERSRNGIDFEVSATIQGAGTSTNLNKYAYNDFNPLSGISYYRLKQTDYDGQFTLSQIIALDRELSEAVVSSLYPNPATEEISFELTSPKAGKLKIEIYDNAGRLLLTKNADAHRGANSFSIDIDQLEKGVYSAIIHFDHLDKPEVRQLTKN
jgi:hypothetical protein